MNRFTKLALSAATAASIAFAPMPAAAEPGGQDFARALAGLAVLGIIANSSRDRDRSRVSRNTTQYGSIEGDRYRRDRDGRVIHGDIRRSGDYRDDRPGYKRAALPGRCLLTVDTGRREFAAYGARCLQRNYKHARKLPQECRWQVRTNRGWRNVYGARCLRRDGWQVARR